MSIHEPITCGDWLRATAKNGSAVEGQAAHDMSWGGGETLSISISGDGGGSREVAINVNFWDVQITRKNLIGRNREDYS